MGVRTSGARNESQFPGVLARLRSAFGKFGRWQSRRPFLGSVLMILAAATILYGPAMLIRYAFLPGSMLWSALSVGAILLAMGVIQMFVPRLAVITGAIGLILSLASLLVALGGFGVGMLLGLAGSALGIAWRENGAKAGSTSRKTFWITYGSSIAAMVGLCFMALNGVIALAAAVPTPVTLTANQINSSSLSLVPGVSGADNTTPVAIAQLTGSASNLTISKQIPLPGGNTVTVVMATSATNPTTFSGLTVDATALTSDNSSFQSMIINAGGTNGMGLNAGKTVLGSGANASVNVASPYLIVNSINISGFNLSIK